MIISAHVITHEVHVTVVELTFLDQDQVSKLELKIKYTFIYGVLLFSLVRYFSHLSKIVQELSVIFHFQTFLTILTQYILVICESSVSD